MNKLGQFITTVVIGGFAVFLAALIVLPMVRPAQAETKEPSTVAQSLSAYPKNLDFAMFIPQDVYGQEWGAVAAVCPGATEDQLKKGGVETKNLNIDFADGAVPNDVNYILLASQTGEFKAEKLPRAQVDLCDGLLQQLKSPEAAKQDIPPLLPFQQGQPLQFIRDTQDYVEQMGKNNPDYVDTDWHLAG
ncbi:hypothetical protein QP999_01390 [Corynebacterium sp. MSK004]|uniref:hypothetical protein n=1 Tax=Corynebacterium sp. MSK004 TaxID=3050186 RepID=UPI00254A767A|nr:hypothetical protein [Corynebacterium sp. MSK004]MDK8896593.1 hypothetical protein [Corynebacterium sp. MSK004]